MSRQYKTAMGKNVDMAALILRNEKVRAVGNMNVNARGDIIDSNDQIINDAAKRVNRLYSKATTNVGANTGGTSPIPGSQHAMNVNQVSASSVTEQAKSVKQKKTKNSAAEPAQVDAADLDDFNEPNPQK